MFPLLVVATGVVVVKIATLVVRILVRVVSFDRSWVTYLRWQVAIYVYPQLIFGVVTIFGVLLSSDSEWMSIDRIQDLLFRSYDS